MEKDFEVFIHFKNRITPRLYLTEQFIQSLRETKEEEILYIKLFMRLRKESTEEEGVAQIAQFKELMDNDTVQKFLKFFDIIVFHFEGFNMKQAVELKRQLNNYIKTGIKFKALRHIYFNGSLMTEDEAKVFLAGIGPEHRESLPRLDLTIKSSVGVNVLDQCLKLGWPIDKVLFKSSDFENTDIDWKQVRRLISGSKFEINLRNEGNQIDTGLFPIVEAVLYADGHIQIRNFDVTSRVMWAVLGAGLERRRKLSKDQIMTLNVWSSNYGVIKIYGTTVDLYFNPDVNLWKLLSEMYSSRERRVLQIESLRINRFDEENIKAAQELLVCISEQDHSLLRISIYVMNNIVEIPPRLQRQIEVNLSKKMSEWIQSGTEVVYGRLKLMMIGQGRAGKSSTIRSLLKQPFDQNLESTLVAEAGNDISINVQDVSSKWKETNMETNWVAGEMGEYLNKVGKHVKNDTTNSILIPVTSTSKQEFKNQFNAGESGFKNEDVSENAREKDIAKSFFNSAEVAGNVREELYGDRSKDIENTEHEKDNVRLTIWDFGGQQVFYALHHLYLTSGGIYVLVFDLSLMLEQMEEELRIINFWLDSAELHAPQASIIMVGTRCNQVKEEDLEEIDNELSNLIENKQVKHLEAGNLSFFPIDNSDQENIEEQLQPLRAIILDQGKEEGNEEEFNPNLWQKKVPLNWIYFMNHLVNKFDGCITANQLFDIGKNMGLDRERDIIPMLEFYQNAGAIIPFMKASPNNEPLVSDYIVLSPEWLLKVLGSFVYDPKLHNRKKAVKKKKNKMTRLIANYEKTGILSKSLLLFILSEAKVHEKDFGFILDLCQEMLIMSKFDFEPKWFTIPNDTFFLVPTMNKTLMTEERVQEDAAVDDCINIYLHCEKAVPIGLFERVICVMLTCNRDFDGSTLKPIIAKNFAMFFFRDIEVFLIDEHKNGDFRISLRKDDETDLNIIVNLLEIGSMIQEKLKADVLGKHVASSIQIKALDENDKCFRCSAEALRTAVSENKPTVPIIDSNGDVRLKKISLLNSFGDAAKLIVERQKQEEEENKLKWEYDVFLAHTWGPNNATHDQVVKIDNLLKERNFITWLDEANLKYYVANDIVDGLKKSSCILVFITELYLEKVENADTNASKEFAQAVKKGTKYLVPVVLDPNCLDPKSWLGSKVGYHLTDALYFDFSSEEKIKANIGKLCERIEEMSQAERPQTA